MLRRDPGPGLFAAFPVARSSGGPATGSLFAYRGVSGVAVLVLASPSTARARFVPKLGRVEPTLLVQLELLVASLRFGERGEIGGQHICLGPYHRRYTTSRWRAGSNFDLRANEMTGNLKRGELKPENTISVLLCSAFSFAK